MTIEHLLNAYIDTNVVLVIVAVVWFGAKRLMARTRLCSDYLTQLYLLYGLIALVAVSPLVVLAADAGQRWGLISDHTSVTFSDFLVSQYLHGHIALAPSTFEKLLMLRSEFTHEIATLGSWKAIVVASLLLGGFLIIVVRNARDTLYLMGVIKRSYILRRIGEIEIRFTHETRVPFSTRGLWRHYIVLPTGLLAHNNDVRIAVSHEIQHVRQRDLTWEIALELMRPFFFWNPAFAICKRDVERVRELACDQQVLTRKTHPVRDYCECLLRVCKTSLSGDRSNQIITPSVPFVQVDRRAHASHSANFLRQRILSVLDNPARTANRYAGAALMVVVCAVVLSATVALRPVNDWSHDRLMLSTIVNLERLNSRSVTP